MIQNEVKPARGGETGFGDRFAASLSVFENTARPVAWQVPSRSIVWLARRARISIEHAAVLAEANHLGGL